MKKYFTFFLTILLVHACNNDDDINDINNGFFANTEFHETNKGYFTSDLTTERDDDFLIFLTDGDIVAFDFNSNLYTLSEDASNLTVFRATQDPESPNALNFAPSATYIMGSENARLDTVNLSFQCVVSDGELVQCESATGALNDTDTAGFIQITHDNVAPINYLLEYNIVTPSGPQISGQFSGVLNRLVF